MPSTIKYGSKGDWVKVLQYAIGEKADGKFGAGTRNALKSFQKAHGLTADGIAGSKTWDAILDNAPTLKMGENGAYVSVLEVLLETMTEDGEYTSEEEAHVKTYQVANGLDADGIVGKKTWAALFEKSAAKKNDDADKDGSGNGAATNGAVRNVQPKNYKQYDSRWGSVPYTVTGSKNQTIKSSGCGTTSMADIIATWWDKSITPKETSAWAVEHGYRTKNSGTAWEYFSRMAKEYKASKFVQTTSFATMRGCLADGGYVVVSFRPSKWTRNGHFCVLWKDDGKTIYVNDPASSSSNRAKGTYNEVKAAAKQYFCFWK